MADRDVAAAATSLTRPQNFGELGLFLRPDSWMNPLSYKQFLGEVRVLQQKLPTG